VNVFATDRFGLPLPAWHTFPLAKYAMLRRRVEASGLVAPGEILTPEAATVAEILRVHGTDYVRRVFQGALSADEQRAIGLPWSAELVERSTRSTGATLAACRAAIIGGVAVNLAGGTHHAHADHGAGYCVFNDAAVAARAMQAEGLARRVIVIDCDVHQGDGTASIFAADPSVFTFSIHAARNYPDEKPPSDLDVALEDGTGDDAYLDALGRGARLALERSGADLAIYLAGADPFEGDRLGRLKLSKAGLAARDRLVFTLCRGLGLPVAVAMAGGYARQIEDTVDVQLQTVREAAAWAGA